MNEENNHKYVHKQAVKRSYTYLFISLKIIFFKKFKKNIFDNPEFTDWLCLLAINEIDLDDQWEKAFHPLYTEIEKV